MIEEQNAPLISSMEQLGEEVKVLKSQLMCQAQAHAQATSSPSPLTTAHTSAPLAPPATPDSAVHDQHIADLEEHLRVARAQKAVAPSEAGTSARGAVAAAATPRASPAEASPVLAISTPGECRPGEHPPAASCAMRESKFPIL